MRSIMKIRVRWKSRVSIKMMRFTIKFGIMISQLMKPYITLLKGKALGIAIKNIMPNCVILLSLLKQGPRCHS